MSNQPTAQQLAQANFNNRMELIDTGLHMVKKLQPVTGPLGGTLRIPLERMGIMTGIMLEIEAPVTIATSTAVQSEFGPYSLINSVSYTDYAGIQRVVTSGFQLHTLTSLRGGRFLNASLPATSLVDEGLVDTNILNLPTAVGSGTLAFSLFIPIAYDAWSDLRGAVLSQSITGDHYVTIRLADSAVNSDTYTAPYGSGGPVALGDVTVTAFQQYIMPQNAGNAASLAATLPMIDLSTIYAIEGNFQDSSNIVSGQSKYINWPNNRAIMSALHIFNNGGQGVLNGDDLTGITLLGNSNTNIREMSPKLVRNLMRYRVGADTASGVYMIESRRQPITTRLYGNVQSKFDVKTANTAPYFVNQYESTYLSGTPLPGIIQ